MNKTLQTVIVSALLLMGQGIALPETAMAQQAATQTYQIPAGDLDSTLRQYAAQNKLQLVYPAELVEGKRSAGLSGTYTQDEALRRLLQGSGLQPQPINARTIGLRLSTPAVPPPQEKKRSENAPEAATEEKATELDPVVVTGSHIRRSEIEGPSPVIVITRQDLDRSGRSTVAEALAQLPQNFASPITSGSGFGNQAVNLRGLGKDNTLVLVNGRRVASSVASGNSPSVDLNSIPLAAVERVEVLTDGASALYGSDAVSGVVNIILKKDFSGSEISVNYGTSREGGASERQVSFVTGWAKAGFNALLSGEYFNRNRLPAANRSFSRTDDLRERGGRDRRSNTANPGNVFSLDGQNLPGLDAPFAGIPAGQNGRDLTTEAFAATTGQLNLQSLVADFSDLVPETERFGLDARLDGTLSSGLTVFAEAGVSRNKSNAGAIPPLINVVVPETNPFNPFGESVRVLGRLAELPAKANNKFDNRRVVVGLGGRLGPRWAWESSVGYSRDEFESRLAPASVAGPLLNALLSRTDPGRALNVFGDGAGANSPDVLAELGFGRLIRDGAGDVLTFAGKADGPMLEWADRELRAAVGWDFRRERFDSMTLQFAVDPQMPSSTSDLGGDRRIIAGFFEFDLPLFSPSHDRPGLRALELQVAMRFEHYSDFGSTADPKLALRWQPIETLAVRGSVGTSFRAPSLAELFRAATLSQITVTDPQRNDESVVVNQIAGGNSDLQSEKSRNWNLGLTWDASFLQGLSLTADFWGLRQTERITALSADELLAAEAFFPDRITRAAPTQEDRDAGLPGRLLNLNRTSLNASTARLRGLDVGLRYRIDSSVGLFDLRANGAYLYRFERRLTPVAPAEQLAGKLSGNIRGEDTDRPEAKVRATLSQFWSRGAWEVGLTERYTGSSRDPFSTLHPVVGSHVEVDVHVNYVWPSEAGWLAGTRLSLAAVNVLNNKPPFRDSTFGFSSALHDPRQAFYQLRVTKAF